MPSEAEHQAKYLECLALLGGPPPLASVSRPWAATVAFYAAVHLIEMLAARDGVHHTRHSGVASRNWYVAQRHPSIYANFSALYSASLLARYEPPAAFAAAYPGDTVEEVLIGRCLDALQTYMVVTLG